MSSPARAKAVEKSVATPMTVKQQRFCDEYLASGNATDAARRAGYSVKTASVQAQENLRLPKVAEYIAAQRNKQSVKTLSRRERILEELDKIAFATIESFTRLDADGRRVIDFSQATPDQLAALASIETKTRKVYTPKGEHVATEHTDKFKMNDKLRGLELLGRAEGLFKDTEVKVTVDVADRLLAARQRLAALPAPGDDEA